MLIDINIRVAVFRNIRNQSKVLKNCVMVVFILQLIHFLLIYFKKIQFFLDNEQG